jgi:hypothetical protein
MTTPDTNPETTPDTNPETTPEIAVKQPRPRKRTTKANTDAAAAPAVTEAPKPRKRAPKAAEGKAPIDGATGPTEAATSAANEGRAGRSKKKTALAVSAPQRFMKLVVEKKNPIIAVFATLLVVAGLIALADRPTVPETITLTTVREWNEFNDKYPGNIYGAFEDVAEKPIEEPIEGIVEYETKIDGGIRLGIFLDTNSDEVRQEDERIVAYAQLTESLFRDLQTLLGPTPGEPGDEIFTRVSLIKLIIAWSSYPYSFTLDGDRVVVVDDRGQEVSSIARTGLDDDDIEVVFAARSATVTRAN